MGRVNLRIHTAHRLVSSRHSWPFHNAVSRALDLTTSARDTAFTAFEIDQSSAGAAMYAFSMTARNPGSSAGAV